MLLELSQLDELIHLLEVDSKANTVPCQAASWRYLIFFGNTSQGHHLCMNVGMPASILFGPNRHILILDPTIVIESYSCLHCRQSSSIIKWFLYQLWFSLIVADSLTFQFSDIFWYIIPGCPIKRKSAALNF